MGPGRARGTSIISDVTYMNKSRPVCEKPLGLHIMQVMRGRPVVRPTGSIQHFFHDDAAAAVGKFNAGHISPHQGQAAATGGFQIFLRTAIGYVTRIVTFALVVDFYIEPFGGQLAIDVHQFGGVVLIAMPNRVAERFFESHLHAKEMLFSPGVPRKRVKNLLRYIVIGGERAHQVAVDAARLLG